jgi:hypothetical protein
MATTATYVETIPDTTPDFETWETWPTIDVPGYPDDIPEPGFIPDDEPEYIPERRPGC